MALIDDFKTRFPEFNPTTVDTAFPAVESDYPVYYGGTETNNLQEILQLLAHLFEIDTQANQTTGGIIEEDFTDYDSFFKSTKYGQSFLAMIKHGHGGKPV